MRVIKVKINKDDDIAKQIGEAVATAIADDISAADKDSQAAEGDRTGDTKTDADALDSQGLREMAQTEEFKKFYKELGQHVNALIGFVEEHMAKYGCSVVIGATLAYGKESSFGRAFGVGRGDSIEASLQHLIEDDSYGGIMRHGIIDKLLGRTQTIINHEQDSINC